MLPRLIAYSLVAWTAAFLIATYLRFWQNFPSLTSVFSDGLTTPTLIMIAIYAGAFVLAFVAAARAQTVPLRHSAESLMAVAAFVTRGAFWSVFLVGLADYTVSFLRVEELSFWILTPEVLSELNRPKTRGVVVHFPLILVGYLIALFTRSLGFVWLALLVVVAEFQIVISRFVFSYEQAFMGDLVRFWYAALFLFASAHTLIEEGHVRVDVIYAGLSVKAKAVANAFGCLVFGIPLCLIIIVLGTASKASVIASPILNFEISQSGFGMFSKYLLAGFLLIFAVSMLVQFTAYFLNAIADLRDEPGRKEPRPAAH